MKKNLQAYFLITVLFLSTGSFSFADNSVSFAIGEWTPYTGTEIEHHGMAAEIVSAACSAAGLTAEYYFMPWVRAENSVLNGEVFGTFPYKELPSRKENFVFSDTLFSSSFAIITLKGHANTFNSTNISGNDFKGLTVGIIGGTDAIRLPLEKAGARVESVPTPEQNLRKLKAGRLDYYIDDRAVIHQTLEHIFSPTDRVDFILLDGSFGEQNDFRIMASRQYPDKEAIIKKINKGLDTIKNNGVLAEILDRYGLQNTSETKP